MVTIARVYCGQGRNVSMASQLKEEVMNSTNRFHMLPATRQLPCVETSSAPLTNLSYCMMRSLLVFIAGFSHVGCSTKPLGQEERPVVELTPKAIRVAKDVSRSLKKQNGEEHFMRISAKLTPDGEFQHEITWSSLSPSADDLVWENDGVKIAIYKPQIPRLQGATVDYTVEGNQGGFAFHNPNASNQELKDDIQLDHQLALFAITYNNNSAAHGRRPERLEDLEKGKSASKG